MAVASLPPKGRPRSRPSLAFSHVHGPRARSRDRLLARGRRGRRADRDRRADDGAGVALGDSIAIDGVCLTVVARRTGRFAFDAVPETLERTALGTLEPGSRVNLEPALRAGDSLGGHYVQGHVDAVGWCAASSRRATAGGSGSTRPRRSSATWSRRARSQSAARASPSRRSTDGLRRRADPAHALVTTLGALVAGDAVNLEADVLAKYVEKLVVREWPSCGRNACCSGSGVTTTSSPSRP